MEEQRSIVIIGGGLSGLALGAYIKDGGFNSIILEKETKIGGVLQTIEKDGYLLEMGANTTSSNLALEDMMGILNLKDELIQPSANSKNRYIVKKSKLKKLSPKPLDLLTSSLFSTGGKWKIYQEQFKKPTTDYEEETVGQFFERRFGSEVVDYVVNPMIAGIYAGDPYKLGMKSVFPQLLEWEQEYGSVIKALKKQKDSLPKRKMVSFKNGMQSLISGFENYIGSENILCGTEATKVNPLENGQFAIQLKQGDLDLEIVADVVVFATPSYITAKFIEPISADLANLMHLPHPKMGVVHLGYDSGVIKKPFNSFGFLVPEKEQKSLLGAIANSSFLPNRAPNGKMLFTLYVGGTRQEHLLESDAKNLMNNAVNEFEQIMGITGKPELREEHVWDRAIPQFKIGHQDMLEGFEFFEKNIENLHILGNYRSGLSVADCIQGAKRAHGTLIKDYSRQSYKKATQQS